MHSHVLSILGNCGKQLLKPMVSIHLTLLLVSGGLDRLDSARLGSTLTNSIHSDSLPTVAAVSPVARKKSNREVRKSAGLLSHSIPSIFFSFSFSLFPFESVPKKRNPKKKKKRREKTILEQKWSSCFCSLKKKPFICFSFFRELCFGQNPAGRNPPFLNDPSFAVLSTLDKVDRMVMNMYTCNFILLQHNSSSFHVQ